MRVLASASASVSRPISSTAPAGRCTTGAPWTISYREFSRNALSAARRASEARSYPARAASNFAWARSSSLDAETTAAPGRRPALARQVSGSGHLRLPSITEIKLLIITLIRRALGRDARVREAPEESGR
jgi:hypothetical protein